MLSRCTDHRPWLLCIALCCASVAYVGAAVVAIPRWLDGVVAPRSYHATGAADDQADPDAHGSTFNDPSLILGLQSEASGEYAGLPLGFVSLVWKKGFDPKPVMIAA